jgi:hypothetical protein
MGATKRQLDAVRTLRGTFNVDGKDWHDLKDAIGGVLDAFADDLSDPPFETFAVVDAMGGVVTYKSQSEAITAMIDGNRGGLHPPYRFVLLRETED